jgi:hypothetical protein
MKKPNKKNYVNVLGITDKVFDSPTSFKEIGHVFFFEIDKKSLNKQDKFFLQMMTSKYATTIYVLKTKGGFHFISFRLFRCPDHMRMFADFLQEFPYTDYNHNFSNKILRIGEKGNSKPPKLYTMYRYGFLEKISQFHLQTYIKAGILKNKHIQPEMAHAKPSLYGKICIYKTKKRFK